MSVALETIIAFFVLFCAFCYKNIWIKFVECVHNFLPLLTALFSFVNLKRFIN